MNQTALLEIDGAIATVTLNRPEVLNALNDRMVEALQDAVTRIGEDRAIRCVVVRGSGGGFMAGGDLRQFHHYLTTARETGEPFPINFDRAHDVIGRLRALPLPVLASVHGPVAGFGFSLMSACDLVIAAEDSFFTLAYCLIGTSPDGGSTFHLPRAVGIKRAMEIALLGDRFKAPEALAAGLINRIVATDDLAAETARLAARLAAGPTAALGRTKALVNASFSRELSDQLAAEAENFLACARGPDFFEGISAFLEKRKPEFRGQ